MQLEYGNMWDVFGQGIFMITTNPVITKGGAVVMGRGMALEAKTRFPSLPYQFAKRLQIENNKNVDYIAHHEDTPIWYFMVKDHWKSQALPAIIEKSVQELLFATTWVQDRFDLNFPGIGNGGLSRDKVLPLLQVLPDTVHIWEKA